MCCTLFTLLLIWNEIPNLLRAFQKLSNASLKLSMDHFRNYSTQTLERTVLCNEAALDSCTTHFENIIWCSGIAVECVLYKSIYSLERLLGVDSLVCLDNEKSSNHILYQEATIALIRISERLCKFHINIWQYGIDLLYPNWQDVVLTTQIILEPLVPVAMAWWYSLAILVWVGFA